MRIGALLLLGAAFLVHGAAASDFTGSLEAGFDTTSIAHHNMHGYGAGGSLSTPLGNSGLVAQIDMSGSATKVGAAYGNAWNAGGDLFWRSSNGVVGLSATYDMRSSEIVGYEGYQFGAFGEWYLPDVTLRVRTGGLRLDDRRQLLHGTNWFGGLAAEYYLLPQLGLTATFDYATGQRQDLTRFAVGVDYLVSNELPFSISADYEHADGDIYGVGPVDGFMLHLKYRFGVSGSLIDIDRGGPQSWRGTYLSPGSASTLRVPRGLGAICSAPGGSTGPIGGGGGTGPQGGGTLGSGGLIEMPIEWPYSDSGGC